jgi:phage tail-like protein
MGFPLPPLSLNPVKGLPMTHRFGVFFFVAGSALNPLDIRFQEVSGLKTTITTRPDTTVASGLCKKVIPTGVDHDDLVLRRGLVIGSLLNHQVQASFNDFKFLRSDLLLTIFSEEGVPTTAFLFAEAYPIEWEINSLNAKEEEILIESLRLTYTRVKTVAL